MGLFAQRCPYCMSTDIEFMNQERKGFNGLVGCIGFLIAWPLVCLALLEKTEKTIGTVKTVVEHLKQNKKF